VTAIRNEEGGSVSAAPHPKERLWISCPEKVTPGDIIRQLY
jgi:hypothetical protein